MEIISGIAFVLVGWMVLDSWLDFYVPLIEGDDDE